MTESIEIRKSVPGDLAAIEWLYPEAFPDEDLLPLVRRRSRKASPPSIKDPSSPSAGPSGARKSGAGLATTGARA